MCKSGLGDWGNIGSARRSGRAAHVTLHDAGNELDAATKVQETQMWVSLHLRQRAACVVKWEGPAFDAIVYNGHAGLGS